MYRMLVGTFAITIQLPLLIGKLEPTDRCPCTKEDWERRAKEFHCNEERMYACMLYRTELVETCMTPFPVKAGTVGCPYILADIEDLGPLVGQNFSSCRISRCPEATHDGYSTNELYTYPACFLPIYQRLRDNPDVQKYCLDSRTTSASVSSSTDSQREVQDDGYDSRNFIIFILGFFVLLLILIVLCGGWDPSGRNRSNLRVMKRCLGYFIGRRSVRQSYLSEPPNGDEFEETSV